jgi:leucyl/phenylalanyl-tRNA--protein transferase
VIPIEGLHVPRRLARSVRQDLFEIRVDTAFEAVIDACAEARADRPETWINRRIRALCLELHELGHAHCVEAWAEGRLAGGLYGIALGGAFFGESMFSRARDASKIALVHLVARLKAGGFVLLDAQFQTEHLAQFGTEEVPREAYRARLAAALTRQARWDALAPDTPVRGAQALEILALPG